MRLEVLANWTKEKHTPQEIYIPYIAEHIYSHKWYTVLRNTCDLRHCFLHNLWQKHHQECATATWLMTGLNCLLILRKRLVADLLAITKQNSPPVSNIYHAPNCQLSGEPNKIMELLQKQIQPITRHSFQPVKRVFVQGKAETGKSTVIAAMTAKLADRLGPHAFKLTAPKGVAARNIEGQTIHEYPPPKDIFENYCIGWTGTAEQIKGTHFVICDEYSMVGMNMLDRIHKRLRQIKASQEFLGGIYVYLVGDIRHLPPVMDVSVYGTKFVSESSSSSNIIFCSFQ